MRTGVRSDGTPSRIPWGIWVLPPFATTFAFGTIGPHDACTAEMAMEIPPIDRCPNCGNELQSAQGSSGGCDIFYYCLRDLGHWESEAAVKEATARRLVTGGTR